MILKYLTVGKAPFDERQSAEEFNSDHHPGSRACRETIKWMEENQFGENATIGAMAMLMFA
jgi:hypothetical protein